jgi:hypothetical protein
MSHNKKYKKHRTKMQKFISSTLNATKNKMISNENQDDYCDTFGIKIKPLGDETVILGKVLHTEPLDINNENGSLDI